MVLACSDIMHRRCTRLKACGARVSEFAQKTAARATKTTRKGARARLFPCGTQKKALQSGVLGAKTNQLSITLLSLYKQRGLPDFIQALPFVIFIHFLSQGARGRILPRRKVLRHCEVLPPKFQEGHTQASKFFLKRILSTAQ